MKKNKILYILYEITMCCLAIFAVILAIMDLTSTLMPFEKQCDQIILYIFIADYAIRLILAKNKKLFLKSNVLDLIAIIPFNSLFKIFRIAKISKLARLSKLSKVFKLTKASSYILRLVNKSKRFLNTNGFKYVLLLSVIIVLLGSLGFYYAENIPLGNSIWWAFVTVTTVGYGDISPATPFGRIIAGILMIVGIGLVGSLTSTITTYFFRKPSNHTSYQETIISEVKEKIDHIEDLSDEDIDTIAAVLKAIKGSHE